MPNYSWPPIDKRKVMGKRISRLDGPAKSSGRAKYNSDINPDGLLFGELLISPHAHAKVTSIDTSEAEKHPGVTAVEVILGPGKEIQWAGAEVAAVAATTEGAARDAVRKIKVEYEVLPHVVREDDRNKAGDRVKAAGEQNTGDPDKAFQEAEVVSEGFYAIPVLTHCCLEPHGQVIAWKGDKVEYWPSTQSVSDIGAQLGRSIGVPVTNIHVSMDYMGGGFGSKFPSDLWGTVCANLSKKSGGRPVKLFLDRATELQIAGNRPSAFAKVKLGAKKDGTLLVWEQESWSSGGLTSGIPATLYPYNMTKLANKRIKNSSVSLNAGGARAWRAPNHPQVSYVTCAALDDLAAKLNMDPMQFFLKNIDVTDKPNAYRSQFAKAAELIDWQKNWHPRGDSGKGPIKRGLGLGIGRWQGAGNDSTCRATIHADGSVDLELGSQDIGTATRTMIAMVAAETFGLSINEVKVKLGDNSFPPAGGSGGSTTVGGVTSATRKATINALGRLFESIAPLLEVPPDQLEAVDGRIQVKGNPAKAITWKQACQKLGTTSITETGRNDPRQAAQEGLNTAGVNGVQMADVSVDVETGVVRMNRMVAVHDCGLVVNPKTAESQVYGACILSIAGALMEERIMDQQVGRMLNADMEFYKLAGIGDIGDIIVHMDISEENDKRGVIGLGEPPTVPGIAAISNAVANAIGVRVPSVPLTPDRVLAALQGRTA